MIKPALTAFVLALASAASAVETLNHSVVLFTSRKSGSPMVHGGGIVVGTDDRAVYIATVGHVATIDDLRVQFYAARGKEYVASVFPESENADVDFAVVSVELPANDPVRRSLRSLACRTDKLATNTPVIHIGHAASVWSSIAGNKVVHDQRNYVAFTNTGVAAASSGGPIFDDRSRLLGLVTQLEVTHASALKTDVILYYLRDWNVPMNLLIGAVAAAEPTPAPKPSTRYNVLLADRFENNRNGWDLRPSEGGSEEIVNGVLRLRSQPKWVTPMTLPVEIDQDRDFEIRATVTGVRAKDSSRFGILWGFRDYEGNFDFSITGDGRVFVTKKSGKASRSSIGRKTVSADEPNRMVIRKSGQKLRFLINGDLVYEMPFVPFFGDRIGFIAFDDVEATFDNLEVVQGDARNATIKIASRLKCARLRYTVGDQTVSSAGMVTEIENLPAGTLTYSIEGIVSCEAVPCTARGVGTITLSGNDTFVLDWVDRNACTVRLTVQH